MPECLFYTTAGHLCHNTALLHQEGVPDHLQCCGIHGRAHRRAVERVGQQPGLDQCIFLHGGRGGTWCTVGRAQGSQYCQGHIDSYVRRVQRGQERREWEVLRELTLDEILHRAPQPTLEELTTELFNRRDLPEGIRYEVGLLFAIRVDPVHRRTFRHLWWQLERAAAPPPPPRVIRGDTLAALARDAQNVHTRYVTEQTNAMEAKLLEVPVRQDQQTEMSMAKEWMRIYVGHVSWGRILKTLTDVHSWFNKATCRTENDNLYRRLLRGAVAKINRSDIRMRDDLYRRLWEECTESVGMCCEGHISRLCNVFVGFDEAFQPPVALGELMQQKMAAISLMDISEEEKRRLANAWFEETGVPTADRAAWLEAF